jgi:hypothetical protein
MQWMLIVTLLLLVIAAAYVLHMRGSDYGFPDRRIEQYMDFIGAPTPEGLPTGRPDLAEFGQGLPLSDVLEVSMGLTDLDASGCAAADSARQMELGGQYVQRTNNYQRDYPDHCSSLLSDFVGGFYKPKKGGVGQVVPCDGQC